jgi:hypothetical protein
VLKEPPLASPRVPGDAAVTVVDQNGRPSGSHQGSGLNGSSSKSSGSNDAWLRRREVPMTEKVKFIRGNDRVNL